MKKSKKSSNKKPKIIFIYGPVAVGKLTVAQVLSEKTGFKLTHNHAINDVVDKIFKRGTSENGNTKLFLRNYLMTQAIKAKVSLVTTYTYSHDYVYPSGLKEEKFVQDLSKKLTKLGAEFLPVHLKAQHKALLRRVTGSSRKNFGKLKDKKILKESLETKDWDTSPKLKNNLVIDNTKLSPNKVADMIIKHFKIK